MHTGIVKKLNNVNTQVFVLLLTTEKIVLKINFTSNFFITHNFSNRYLKKHLSYFSVISLVCNLKHAIYFLPIWLIEILIILVSCFA